MREAGWAPEAQIQVKEGLVLGKGRAVKGRNEVQSPSPSNLCSLLQPELTLWMEVTVPSPPSWSWLTEGSRRSGLIK